MKYSNTLLMLAVIGFTSLNEFKEVLRINCKKKC